MFWGTFVGRLFMMPLAGAAVGAASGALRGKFADLDIDDDFMREVASALQSGKAALFRLVRKMTADKLLAGIKGAGGRVLRGSLDETKGEALFRRCC